MVLIHPETGRNNIDFLTNLKSVTGGKTHVEH